MIIIVWLKAELTPPHGQPSRPLFDVADIVEVERRQRVRNQLDIVFVTEPHGQFVCGSEKALAILRVFHIVCTRGEEARSGTILPVKAIESRDQLIDGPNDWLSHRPRTTRSRRRPPADGCGPNLTFQLRRKSFPVPLTARESSVASMWLADPQANALTPVASRPPQRHGRPRPRLAAATAAPVTSAPVRPSAIQGCGRRTASRPRRGRVDTSILPAEHHADHRVRGRTCTPARERSRRRAGSLLARTGAALDQAAQPPERHAPSRTAATLAGRDRARPRISEQPAATAGTPGRQCGMHEPRLSAHPDLDLWRLARAVACLRQGARCRPRRATASTRTRSTRASLRRLRHADTSAARAPDPVVYVSHRQRRGCSTRGGASIARRGAARSGECQWSRLRWCPSARGGWHDRSIGSEGTFQERCECTRHDA